MSDRVALVTGSSSGFGLLTTVELARAGFRVVATMRDLGRRARLDKAAEDAGVSSLVDVQPLDVTDFTAMPPLIEDLIAEYGRLDVLVNNAGFALAGFAEDVKIAELRSQLETNFFGQVALTRSVLPQMRRQKSGHIILVSSISGRLAGPGRSSYSASKFALEGWAEGLRLEVHGLGIRVVLVEPGGFETGIWTRGAQFSEVTQSGASPNQERIDRLRRWAEKLPKGDPRVVAQLIARLAQSPNPRLRYVVGRDARLHLLLRRLLPWRLYEKRVLKFLGI